MKNSPNIIRIFIVLALAISGLLSRAAWPVRTTTGFASPERGAAFVPPRGEASEGEKQNILTTLKRPPLSFVENRGQVDERVAFYVQGRDKSIYFTPQGITFALTGEAKAPSSHDATSAHAPFNLAAFPKAQANAEAWQRWALKLDFVDANPHVRLKGEDPTSAVNNYLKGRRDRWETGVPSYATLVYENLWPGIDLIYEGRADRLKYEFVVRPGADPNQIKLAYRGASSVGLNAEGQLEITTPAGGFRDDTPYSYQEINGQRVEVGTAFAVHAEKNSNPQSATVEYGFRVEDYDRSKPLVIDPAMLIYAGYVGGEGDERGFGIAVDTAGNAYVTGATSSNEATFPVTAGADTTFNGVQDVFVVKVNSAGTGIVYATYLGGEGDDVGFDIAVDTTGNAYVTGATSSNEAMFPVTIGPDLSFNGGGYDAFVAMLNPAGNALVYCGYIGGAGEDGGAAIAVDDGGNAYITGGTSSSETTFPVAVGPDLAYNGGLFFGDAFVAKINPSGASLVFCGYIGGAGEDLGLGIAIDGRGNLYVAGGTTSNEATFPVTVGPDLIFNGGLRDAFVAKVQADGASLAFCGYVAGAGGDTAFGISVDSAGNAYIAGETTSNEASFPVTVGPDLTYNGGGDAFVAKINPAGTALVYCGYIGGAGRDGATDVRVNSAGNAHVAGGTNSSEATFLVRAGPDLTYNGGGDAFVAKVSRTGASLDYCGYVGGDADDIVYALALDRDGNAYIIGETSSTQETFPIKVGPDLAYNGGARDAFIAKIGIPLNSPPDCRSARPSVARLWPPNHQKVAVSIHGVTDPDGDAVTIRIDRIMQDEPTNGPSDGNACPDAFIPPNISTAYVKAERTGGGNGRVYTIYFTASDARGGSCQGSIKVSVPHNQSGAAAVDDGPLYDSTICTPKPKR